MKKNQGSSSMISNSNIPSDVIFDILLQLPIKTVVRCKAVCKLWYKIIDDPRLGYMHWKKTKKPHDADFLLECGKISTQQFVTMRYFRPSLLEPGKSIDIDVWINSNKPESYCSSNDLHVVGSCNGLICVYDQGKFEIYNPLYSKTESYNVGFDTKATFFRTDFGFGFDVSIHKFKIVRLVGCFGSGSSYYVRLLVHELGGLSTPRWRSVSQSIGSSNIICYSKSAVFIDGCLHWFATDRNSGEGTNKWIGVCKAIVSFNLTTEVIKLISLPEHIFGSSSNLGDLDGNLCVVASNKGNINIWVFCRDNDNNEDNSDETTKKWVRKYCIEWLWGKLEHVQLVGFFKAGHILMKNHEGQYFSYNTQNCITTHLSELENMGILCHRGSLIRPSNLVAFAI